MNSRAMVQNSDVPANIEGAEEGLKKAFDLCVSKARANIKRLADEPKSAAWAVDGQYFDFKEGFYEIGNWTSSFFTGMALLAWRKTEDEFFLKQVLRLAPHYREKVFTRHLDTHDTGANAWRRLPAAPKANNEPIAKSPRLCAFVKFTSPVDPCNHYW